LIKVISVAFGYQFDGAVRIVAHPAFYIEMLRKRCCPGSKADALYMTKYDKMYRNAGLCHNQTINSLALAVQVTRPEAT